MDIRPEIRAYVIENFLPGGGSVTIEDTTPLITGGLIDSIGMIGLVRFIESRFQIEFTPREIDAHRLDTIEAIERLVLKKLEGTRP
ncbi:MAG TPA: acyl carrier protein [Bryobacteraceae bacterium]|nr:acyl carrier protein [Bryobacteraceae bacterium]